MRSFDGEFPRMRLCQVLGVARSSAGYQSRTAPRDLSALKASILNLRVLHRGYGVRRMFELLRKMRVAAPRSQVQRAYRELGIVGKRPQRRVRTTNSNHAEPRHPNLMRGLILVRPDQAWVADVTYVRIGPRFGYLALLMDAYTRQIVGWELGAALGAGLTLPALEMALGLQRRPEIHHSDQDAAYACKAYVARLGACKAKLSMAEAGQPKQNAYAERLNRTVKEEEVYLSEYQNLEQARDALKAFITHYNETRIHSSLKYQTPSEVFNEWIQLHGAKQ